MSLSWNFYVSRKSNERREETDLSGLPRHLDQRSIQIRREDNEIFFSHQTIVPHVFTLLTGHRPRSQIIYHPLRSFSTALFTRARTTRGITRVKGHSAGSEGYKRRDTHEELDGAYRVTEVCFGI
jgi:hypothetical protein